MTHLSYHVMCVHVGGAISCVCVGIWTHLCVLYAYRLRASHVACVLPHRVCVCVCACVCVETSCHKVFQCVLSCLQASHAVLRHGCCRFRRLKTALDGCRLHKKDSDDLRRLERVQDGSRRLKTMKDGLRRLETV